MLPRLTACVLAAALALAATGCGGSDGGGSTSGGDAETTADRPAAAQARTKLNGADKPRRADFPKPKKGGTLQELADSIGATGTQVGLATSVFTPGRNRVAFGVLNDENTFVYGPSAVYVAPTPASKKVAGPFMAPADLLITEPAFRSQQAATESDPFAAVYEAPAVTMDKPGEWFALVVTKVGDRLVAAPTQFKVTARSAIPAVGDRAPSVATDTVTSAGGNLESIDTRRPPARELHDTSFDEVVGKKPVALLFATPQLCQSRVCGPVVDIALQLEQKYGDRVQFIHQEVYVDNEVDKGLREPLKAFGLETEPWLFAIGKDGRVAARLEGSFGLNASERAIRAALAG